MYRGEWRASFSLARDIIRNGTETDIFRVERGGEKVISMRERGLQWSN